VSQPPVWTNDQLVADRAAAEEHFRDGRHTEPLEVYLELFDKYQAIVDPSRYAAASPIYLSANPSPTRLVTRKRQVLTGGD